MITPDVYEEALWKPWIHLAEAYDYRGCWSFPIKTRESLALARLRCISARRVKRHRTILHLDIITQSAAVIINNHSEMQERASAEEALRASEERVRMLIENLPGSAALIVDHDLRYLLAEGEALHDAGMKPEDLVGRSIFETLDVDVSAEYETSYRQALHGTPFAREHEAHGHSYLTRGVPLRDAHGKIYAALAVSYDITTRKRIEEALRASEARFRTLTDAVPQLIWANAAGGTANYFNQRWFTYSGLSLEESVGPGWQAIVHPDDAPASKERWQRSSA